MKSLTVPVLALALTASATTALADPPPWAPAHGRRHHHEQPIVVYEQPPVVVYQQPPVVVQRQPQVLVPSSGSMLSCNRDIVGGLLGGATGGVLGSQVGKGTGRVVATAAGTLVGVLVGGGIGRSMDEADEYCATRAFEQARPNQTVSWRNPDGAAYQIQPARQFRDDSGRQCREFTSKVTIGGRPQQAYGTACRQPDGAWEIVG